MIYYRHCELEKAVPTGSVRRVSWIPEKYARLGEILKLKMDSGWENGWIVRIVGERADEVAVRAFWNLWTKTRKASDLPQGTFRPE
jgi:hypothetical protein